MMNLLKALTDWWRGPNTEANSIAEERQLKRRLRAEWISRLHGAQANIHMALLDPAHARREAFSLDVYYLKDTAHLVGSEAWNFDHVYLDPRMWDYRGYQRPASGVLELVREASDESVQAATIPELIACLASQIQRLNDEANGPNVSAAVEALDQVLNSRGKFENWTQSDREYVINMLDVIESMGPLR